MDKNKIQFSLDSDADILSMSKVDSYIGQDSEEISEGVVIRVNPQTQKIEMIEILNFSKRFSDNSVFNLPIVADFFLAS